MKLHNLLRHDHALGKIIFVKDLVVCVGERDPLLLDYISELCLKIGVRLDRS